MWKIVAMGVIGGNCLNARDTPPLFGGPYPTGTFSYYTVAPGFPAGLPLGTKLLVIS